MHATNQSALVHEACYPWVRYVWGSQIFLMFDSILLDAIMQNACKSQSENHILQHNVKDILMKGKNGFQYIAPPLPMDLVQYIAPANHKV